MNKNNQTIGIIGGMGPQASAKLLEIIVVLSARDYGAKKDSDFPNIIMNSVAVPDFISNKKSINNVLSILTKATTRLEIFNPICFGIACNTAHILIESLQKTTYVPFVSIIESVATEVKKSGIKKVGLMATPVTLKSKLYQKELTLQGIKVILPTERQKKELDDVIREVLTGSLRQSDQGKLLKIAESLKTKGAQGIILGCTELPLIFPKTLPIPIFDSIEILAKALLEKAYEKNNN